MLISLEDAFENGLDELRADGDALDSLSNLLLADKEGKHALTAKRAVVRTLSRWPELVAQRGDPLRRLEKTSAEHAAIRASARVEVVVENRRDGGLVVEREEPTVRFRVPLRWFVDSAQIQATVLLVEADDDLRIYCRVASAYAEIRPKVLGRGWRCTFDPLNAGGGNIRDQLFQKLREHRFVFVIVDSDRSEEGGRIGSTARSLPPLNTVGVWDRRVLEHRELENLIPAGLALASVGDGDADLRGRLDTWATQDAFFPNPSSRYLDMKAGTDTLPKLGSFLGHVAAHVETMGLARLREVLACDDGDWQTLAESMVHWGRARRRIRVP